MTRRHVRSRLRACWHTWKAEGHRWRVVDGILRDLRSK